MLKMADKDICTFLEIYEKDKDNSNPSIENVLAVLDSVNFQIDSCVATSPAYWEFMSSIVSNIETGKWTMHPYMWVSYVAAAGPDESCMNDSKIREQQKALSNECINMLRRLKIPQHGFGNKTMLIHWMRNPNGFQDILATVKALIDLNNLFSKKGNE